MELYFDDFLPTSLTGAELDQLLSLGWYRSGQHISTYTHTMLNMRLYRLFWIRYAISHIVDRPTHKRIRKKNKNFRFEIADYENTLSAHQELYKIYYSSIDFKAAPSIEHCLLGFELENKNIYQTKCISIYDGRALIAAGYFDVGETAVASILHFFHPAYYPHSLGKYLILLTLEYMKEHGYAWYYPGYVMQNFSKMNYKLFLGSEIAEYLDFENKIWKKFHPSILTDSL